MSPGMFPTLGATSIGSQPRTGSNLEKEAAESVPSTRCAAKTGRLSSCNISCALCNSLSTIRAVSSASHHAPRSFGENEEPEVNRSSPVVVSEGCPILAWKRQWLAETPSGWRSANRNHGARSASRCAASAVRSNNATFRASTSQVAGARNAGLDSRRCENSAATFEGAQ